MILTTDFHSHILPGIDDGSHSIADSIMMIQKEHTDGVENIFLTPHFYPQQMYPDSFLKNRQQAMAQLRNALPIGTENIRFILGAEVLFCPGMSKWTQLDDLTLGKTKYLLLEMPFGKWSESVYSELNHIRIERGITPILAHIERYFPLFGVNGFIKRLQKSSVLLQSNCNFIIDKHTQHIALKLIREHKIHFIGSDCHSPNWRSPQMAQAREVLLTNVDKQSLLFLEDSEKLVVQ